MDGQTVEEFAKERLRNLIKCSENFSLSSDISIERYLRLSKSVLSKARFYIRDKNYEAALFHSTKLAILLLERFPSHPEYKNCDSEQRSTIKTLLEEIIPLAERCKIDTIGQYKKEESERRANIQLSSLESSNFENKTPTSTPSHKNGSKVQSILQSSEFTDSTTKSPDGLAKNLASHNFVSRSHQPSPVVRNEVDENEKANRIFESLRRDLKPQKVTCSDTPSSKYMKQSSDIVQSKKEYCNEDVKAKSYESDDIYRTKIMDAYSSLQRDLPKPDLDTFYDSISNQISSSNRVDDSRYSDNDDFRRTRPVPLFNRELKPSIPHLTVTPPPEAKSDTFVIKSSRNYDDLTPIILPYNIRSRFERCAIENTLQNIETCGLLVGKVTDDGAYLVTHLLIPKQKGTSDGCQMLGEHECMMFQDKHQLLTIGWIHSHPSQTAFLSSVDLHTHFGYQCLLSEAIAYVVSHKYDEAGIFNLTDYGFSVINKCKSSGHHLHPDASELFQRVAHVIIDEKLSVELIDFRNKDQ